MFRHLLVIGLLAVFSFSFTAASPAADVQVTFADRLTDVIPKVDRVERQREEYFRKYRDDQRRIVRSERRLATSRFINTRWAGEELIADLDDFTVENVVKALVNANLEFAGLGETSDRFEVVINRLRVTNHSVSRLRGSSSYVVGTVARIDGATGRTIATEKITANLVIDFSVDKNYDGPHLAYADTDPDRRVGPALAYFVKRAMEALYPDKEFRRPTVITYT